MPSVRTESIAVSRQLFDRVVVTMGLHAWKTSVMKEQKRHKFVGLKLKLLNIMRRVMKLDTF